MKMNDLFQHTFKAMRHELGHDRPRDTRPLWQRRLSCESPFCRALVANGYLTEEQMQRAALRYRLGMSRDGGVIFWQIDEHNQLHDGKIMYYRPDCHRDHNHKPTWASYLLKRSGQLPQDFKSEHCLFGLHLIQELQPPPLPLPFLRPFGNKRPQAVERKGGECLRNMEAVAAPRPSKGRGWGWGEHSAASCNQTSPPSEGLGEAFGAFCIVESEKTAVIMSEVKPDYLWLATGGKTELNVAKLRPLAGRRVILFPDTDETGDTYREWYEVAQAATDVFGHPVTVSSLLEQHATKAQKTAKIDIADMLFPAR